MPAERVRRLLGEPDAVRTLAEGRPLSLTGLDPEEGQEVWLYGMRGAFRFATLGEVLVDEKRQAVAVRSACSSWALAPVALRVCSRSPCRLHAAFRTPRRPRRSGPFSPVAGAA